MTPDKILPIVVACAGIIISATVLIHQITLHRRMSYVTSLLHDEEIISFYKIFLKDLRFIYLTLTVFPEMRIDEITVNKSFKTEHLSYKMEYITAYIRHVLRGDERLGQKYFELKEQTDVKYEPTEIFIPENLSYIRQFILSIMKGITFHPVRPWFVALFSPSKKHLNEISDLIQDYKLLFDKHHIEQIENRVTSFMIGKW